MNKLYRIIDEGGRDVLFEFNEVQHDLYRNLHDSNIILKSRQHGITTFFCLFGLDTAIHVPNVRVGIIAHNREDAERFFRDKVKYAWDHIDPAYKELWKISASQDSARELSFTNNSSIRVGTSLRSSTLNILHVSEFAKVCAHFPEKAQEIVTGALNTVHEGALVSIESTAEGRSGYFFDFCQQAKNMAMAKQALTRLDFKFHFFPWWQDRKNTLAETVVVPERIIKYFDGLEQKEGIKLSTVQKSWYAKKEAILGEDMMREHPSTPDEAFHTSIEGAYFKRQFDRIYQDQRITVVPFDDALPVYTSWDLGMSDTTCIWFFQRDREMYRFFDYYENSGEGLPHYIKILREKPYRYDRHYGPHDLAVRDWSAGNKTRQQIALEKGLRFTVVKRTAKEDQIESARQILAKSVFDESKCSDGIKALESYRKEWDDHKGCWKDHPLHDWASHPADSFMVAATAQVPDIGMNNYREVKTVPLAREATY